MPRMDLATVQAAALTSFGGAGETGDNLINLPLGHCQTNRIGEHARDG